MLGETSGSEAARESHGPDEPFTFIEVTGTLTAPSISFDPLGLVLVPVPLLTVAQGEFHLIATNYLK